MEAKNDFSVAAPPLFWGAWTEIYAQFGVTGPNADQHQTRLNISFHIVGRGESSFDVEIKGGDRLIRTLGPGSARVTITGNVATGISIRCKSHSVPLNVRVQVR